RDRKVTLKTRPDFDPAVRERDDRRIYEWRAARQPGDDDREKGDKKKRPAKSRAEPSAVRLTTFPSWEELGRWYRDLERPQRQPSQEIRDKAAELTAGLTTDLEKLQTLYEYVASNFRYVSLSFGTGRYQPHRAADVLH